MKNLFAAVLLAAMATSCFAGGGGGEELAAGVAAPKFSLVNAVDGKTVNFNPGDGKLSVVVFTCNQCPYAKAFEPRIIEVAKQYQAKGVVFYALDPNDEAKYSVESLPEMKARAVEKGYPFPYLKDGDSAVARAYGARVTPHVYAGDTCGDDTAMTITEERWPATRPSTASRRTPRTAMPASAAAAPAPPSRRPPARQPPRA